MKLFKQNSMLFLCFPFFVLTSNALNSDGLALLSLLNRWKYLPSSISSSWNRSDSFPCSWVGIKCDSTAHNVISLNLSSYGVYGQLGSEIGHLSRLKTLDLSDNSFSGPIPSELGNCSLLESLNLSRNKFTGKIPESLKNLRNLYYLGMFDNSLSGDIPESLFLIPSLEYVYLNQNALTGIIPSSIGKMSKVLFIYLYSNKLSGVIPSSIGKCSKLEELDLSQNQLKGVIPKSLSNLKSIKYLYLADNGLVGSIPFELGNLENLYSLDLSYNSFNGGLPPSLGNSSSLAELIVVSSNLSGNIPSSLGQLDKLQILRLPENNLSGTIPTELGNCKSLKEMQLYTNSLEGEIPSELGMLTELRDLELFENHLMGEIPLSIWKIPNLRILSVYNNSLSGELPLQMTELKQLRNISLFNNHFSGVIPKSLGINSSLEVLDFTNNKFSGQIPPYLCFGKQLRVLNMGLNQFEGSIPSEVGSCSTLRRLILKENRFSGVLPEFTKNPNLSYMEISGNNIEGEIPSSLVNLSNITYINLSMNNFTGLIPQELGKLVELHSLKLSYNNLVGSLPSQLSGCTKLDIFDVGFNSLNGSIPLSLRSWNGLSTFILSENHFTGGIPPFLWELEKLSVLQIGGNPFGGEIPPSLGSLQNPIIIFNLSNNRLTGSLPADLGMMKLERLFISHNNLSGSLKALDDIPSLTELNISFNNFTGPIPGTLTNFLYSSSSSFLGNPGLCVNCVSSSDITCNGSNILQPCDYDSSKRKTVTKVQIAMIVVGSSIFIVLLLVGLVYLFLACSRKKQPIEISETEGPTPLLNKVMEATENLNDRYVIGKGGHGTVYRASLSEDKVFAVKKVVYAGNKGGSLSMVREIQTVGKIRHRNLVKLEEFWLRKDYGLILYRYMENGSLHDVLHETNPRQTLEWHDRYNIAIGIAHGLAYLHFDCDPAIVHRDIKPKNILLDSDMEPHIADFGIAKLLDQSSNSTTSISVSGTIGYIAPENAFTTTRSKESDVYSYGVVLLELLTRKKALDPSFTEDTDIVGWVRSIWCNTEEIEIIVDSGFVQEMLDSNIREQVENVLQLALRCTEKEPTRRPTMRDVVKQLMTTNPCRQQSKKSYV